MSDRLRTVSPVDGSVYVERDLATPAEIAAALERARAASVGWRRTPIAERVALVSRGVDAFVAARDRHAEEITWQMGRPIAQSPGEVRGFEERARYVLSIAAETLADVDPGPKPGFRRFIRREPLGVVLAISPWNYPYLTAVNLVVPALAAGNVVILRHSPQTPLCAERIVAAFRSAGVPPGVLQFLHASDEDTDRLVGTEGIDHVAFTGSVRVGHLIQRFASDRFVGVGLELGGKDPAYVRADADLGHAVENIVDGAFFNSGQSCCAVERVYVDAAVHDEFVERAVALARGYRLGRPTDPSVTLGPLVHAAAADAVRAQVEEAVRLGAVPLLSPGDFPADAPGTPYLAPQFLVGVHHGMRLMTDETFGPVVGIQRVAGDVEALRLMNDSRYGLTASIWTRDVEAAVRLGDEIETGTVFLNRCDALDPALAWTGVKDSGRGVTLSRLGLEALTRPKSFHLRLPG
ncbi:MAG: aldehyde dehydrogenase family protein [Deltaproteobacteria bacterium]|nr:aldehyde dehydrogenase family protein [Deltaproteobacteria bacterium]